MKRVKRHSGDVEKIVDTNISTNIKENYKSVRERNTLIEKRAKDEHASYKIISTCQ